MMHNPPHPGAHIREDYLKPLGLSITLAAEALGVSRKALSEVINGRAGVSVDMAMRLGKHCYCEKPLTHTVYEARTLATIARDQDWCCTV